MIDVHRQADDIVSQKRFFGKGCLRITTRYYKLTFGSMAENLTLNLINRYVWRDKAEVKEVNQRSFDKLYMVEDGSRKQIFAYWDNQAIHVTYYGKERIEDIIPPLAQKIS